MPPAGHVEKRAADARIFERGQAIGPCGPQPQGGGAANLLSSLVKVFVKFLSSFLLAFASFSKFFFGGFEKYQWVIRLQFVYLKRFQIFGLGPADIRLKVAVLPN